MYTTRVINLHVLCGQLTFRLAWCHEHSTLEIWRTHTLCRLRVSAWCETRKQSVMFGIIQPWQGAPASLPAPAPGSAYV